MTAIPTSNALPLVTSGSFQGYLNMVYQTPVLSKQEEVELFEKFQLAGDLEAARQLVVSNLRYVVYIARSYAGYGLPLEDLVQQGTVGLMKSVKRFDLKHEVRLISFAVHWIKAEIHDYVLKNWRMVKVATTKAQRKLFFNLRKAKKRLGWFNQEEIEAVAQDLGVKPEEVLEMESRLAGSDESFDLPVQDVDEESRAPAVVLSGSREEDPALLVQDASELDSAREGLRMGIASLDERSRDIVEQRWLAEQKTGLRELSEKYGVSMERIRQIEVRALEKLLPYVEV
jgi:RNA polymerase sigma-32 factor